MFSDVGEERLYSTGNDELDDLLKRAFCEGYEHAQKEFSISILGKNESFREDLYNLEKAKPAGNNSNIPPDIRRLFSILKKQGAKTKMVQYSTTRGAKVFIYSEDEILKQFESGKTPISTQEINEPRVTIAEADTIISGKRFIICWYVKDKKFKISKESGPFSIKAAIIDSVLNKKSFEICYETKSLRDAFLWLDNNIRHNVIKLI